MRCNRIDSLLSLTFSVAIFLALSVVSQGQPYVVDSGTPDETSNRSVFFQLDGPNIDIGQFAAQQFTLAGDTIVSQIEVYLGGSAGSDDYHIYLTDAIGTGTGGDAVIDDFLVPPPGTSPDAGVWTSLLSSNLPLDAGTYFVVFATDTESGGGFLPIEPPNAVGSPYLAVNSALDVANPYASDFSVAGGTRSFGLRITAVPEPASVLLAVCAAFPFVARRRQRSLHQ